MAEFKQFLFVSCIILDILCFGIIISNKLEDLKKRDAGGYLRVGKFVLIVLVFATSYIISYLL